MKYILLALVLLFGGCAGSLTELKETTRADVQLALKWAQEDKDVLAIPCWTAIDEILTTTKLPVFDREAVGVLSFFQAGRGVRHDIEGVGSSELRNKFLLGCAALKTDERDLLIKLGIKFVR